MEPGATELSAAADDRASDKHPDEGKSAGRQQAEGLTRASERAWRALVALVAVLSIPLGVGLIKLHSGHWYPTFDFAATEIRVRDVASRHIPLIGLAGRIGSLANQGSHPGPISFYLLFPFWKLSGS